MKDCAYITKQPRGIFTAVGRLVSSKTLTEEEEKEYWRNREYFERVLPVPPFYEKNNPDGAITWFKDNEEAKDIWDQMTFYREMCNKYGVKLYISECDEIPGEIVYEDAFQIAVKNQPQDIDIITKELHYFTAFATDEAKVLMWKNEQHRPMYGYLEKDL